jgi:hypothetical protein
MILLLDSLISFLADSSNVSAFLCKSMLFAICYL